MTAGVQLPGGNEMLRMQQQVAQLQALLEASRQVHAADREEEVLGQVMRIVVRELEMDGAAFPSANLSFGDVPPAFENCAASESGVVPLSYPLDDHEGNRLTELVVWPPEGRRLTEFEDDFIQRLTQQAAVALENLRNQARNIAFAVLEQDLEAARTIQRSRLPQKLPVIPGYSLGYRSVACYHVGGDYLDIIPQPDGSQLMVVADVAGKGLTSAIMGTSFRSAFRTLAASGRSLEDIAARINRYHWDEGEEARRLFVTAIFLKLHAAAGEIEVVNAGHNPGIFLQPGEEPYLFGASDVPIGILERVRYENERREFKPGARLLLYTDGLTEVFKGEEEFGIQGLLETFAATQTEKADDILDALWKAIDVFSDGGTQRDDMTALALCREIREGRPL